MKEIMVLHACSCYLEVLAGGAPYGPELRIVCTAVSNAPGSDLKACEESTTAGWPNASAKSMEGVVFAALFALDFRLSAKWWKQDKYELP
jgi:hypothetical protein